MEQELKTSVSSVTGNRFYYVLLTVNLPGSQALLANPPFRHSIIQMDQGHLYGMLLLPRSIIIRCIGSGKYKNFVIESIELNLIHHSL
jgi:hypothetical protein